LIPDWIAAGSAGTYLVVAVSIETQDKRSTARSNRIRARMTLLTLVRVSGGIEE
jgi:hypothetical protein